MSASRTSCRVGSSVLVRGRGSRQGDADPARPRPGRCHHPHAGRTPAARSISTSAMSQLVVGSQPGELDAGRLADHAAAPVATDEVLRPQRLAVGQRDVDAACRPARSPSPRVRAAIGTPSSSSPAGQDALEVALQQREPVVVAGGEVADVKSGPRRTPATCIACPSARNRSAMPRWSSTSMVRECRPLEREPSSS